MRVASRSSTETTRDSVEQRIMHSKRSFGFKDRWLLRSRLCWSSLAGDLDFDAPAYWASDELHVRRRMRQSIPDAIELARDLESLAFDLLSTTIPLDERSEVLRVHATLITRVLQDLPVSVSSALFGYTMQSWTLAASSFEAANMMGFIGRSRDRAVKWLNHVDRYQNLVSVRRSVKETFDYLEIGSDLTSRQKMVDQEYSLYGQLCMAKHVNPISERNRYLFIRRKMPILRLTPIHFGTRVKEAKLGLALGTRAATLANWVFYKTHSQNDLASGTLLFDCATRSLHAVKNWKLLLED